MMGIVKAQIRRVAGPVADLGAENARPDRQILLDVDGAHDDVGQALDTRVPAGKVAPARIQWTHDQFDAVAAEVCEPDHVFDLAQSAIFGGTPAGWKPKLEQAFKSRVEIARIMHLETDRLYGMVARREGKRVVPEIRAEGCEFLVPVDRLKSENALSKISCVAEVVHDEAHVA
jgi:hypothetical protein